MSEELLDSHSTHVPILSLWTGVKRWETRKNKCECEWDMGYGTTTTIIEQCVVLYLGKRFYN